MFHNHFDQNVLYILGIYKKNNILSRFVCCYQTSIQQVTIPISDWSDRFMLLHYNNNRYNFQIYNNIIRNVNWEFEYVIIKQNLNRFAQTIWSNARFMHIARKLNIMVFVSLWVNT